MTRTTALSALSLLLTSLAVGCGSEARMPEAPPQPSLAQATPASAGDGELMVPATAAPAAPGLAAPPEPPPPPPMTVRATEELKAAPAAGPRPSKAGAVVMRDVERRDARPAAAPAEAVAVMPAPGVRAGEWDDNANYREFQKWLGTEAGQAYHRVDVRDRQFIVVRDADGRAMPRCQVSIIDERGHRTTLTTTASGRAILFPHAEGLAGNDLTAATICQNGTAQARFSLAQSDGVVDMKLQVKRALPATRDVDVAFILDTTGSMSEEIAAVKSTLQKVATALSGANVRVRIGLVEYKDRGDPFVTKVYPMTNDVASFSRLVSNIEASGGGDTPESMNEGLHVGLSGLRWSDSAVARMAFLIADAPPHLDYPNDFDYAADMRDAAHKGIQVFTVAASGMDDLGQVVFRQVAQYTGATNMFVLRGGAGSQSTGGGDPRSSCGGTQSNYASGNLDGLIVQKINREIRGLDRDPLRIAGLRTDENAKPCKDRLLVAE